MIIFLHIFATFQYGGVYNNFNNRATATILIALQ